MSNVKIITDSTCDLPESLVNELGIIIVPLKVTMDNETFISGKNLSSENFYKKMLTLKNTPITTPPSPTHFFEAYEEAANETENIISIHISRLMSETIISAEQARYMLPHMDIRIYDSKVTGASLGLVVLLAARAAKEGKEINEISRIVEYAIENVKVIGIPSTLKYLIKGGRIGKARGLIGKLFGMIPVLSMSEGETSSLTTIHGKENAINWMIEYLHKDGLDSKSFIALTHGNIAEEAVEFRKKIEETFQCKPQFMGYVGPIVGSHLGPGTIFFSYLKK